MDNALLIGDGEHFVLVMGHIEGKTIGELLADFVVPGESQFGAAVFDVAAVNEGGSGAKRSQGGGNHEPIDGFLDVPVKVNPQAGGKETGVKAQVELFRGFPGHVLVGKDVGVSPGGGIVFITKEIGVGIEGNGGQVLEVVDVTISVLTPASAEFQEVEYGRGSFHKGFLGDDPPG